MTVTQDGWPNYPASVLSLDNSSLAYNSISSLGCHHHQSYLNIVNFSTTIMAVPNTNLIKVLPNEELTKLNPDAQPTAVMIRTLQCQLYANARSVPSSLGGGNLGLLGLVFEVADYLELQPPA